MGCALLVVENVFKASKTTLEQLDRYSNVILLTLNGFLPPGQ